MSEFKYNDKGERVIQSPCVNIETALGHVALTWLNTRIRIFEEPQYNHLEYRDEDGTKGMLVTSEFLDQLYELNFPILSMPFVDESTKEWFINAISTHLDDELEVILTEACDHDGAIDSQVTEDQDKE